MYQSEGKTKLVLRKTSPYISIIQPFRILIGFENLLNKALRRS